MTRDEDYDFLYKIVIIGEAGVGKTHLLSRYIKGNLPKNPTSTIGVEFATRTVPLPSGGTVKAQIWDTAGQERYRSITCAHYRRSIGALLVYDITNEKSFIACRRWMEELRDNAEPDIVIMLVGNKIDLVEQNPENRKVDFDAAARFAKSNGLMFQETSTFIGINVREAFEGLLQAIYQTKSQAGINKNRDSGSTQFGSRLSRISIQNSCCG
jgi:small GTP-binding protein